MDGTNELMAMTDGYGESSESWANLLRDCGRRGTQAPLLTAGVGALGFSNTLSQVLPETRHQRRWMRRTANVLDCLPKSAQPAGKKAIQDICDVEDGDHAARAAHARWRAVSASQLAERSGAVAAV
ncbi:transposase [Streptomyces sp. NPDC004330]|uniref:transposase n=1 Tax=Streptomyces sp. NPDC004330 TaxID=3364700 RepID=UPI0036904B2A